MIQAASLPLMSGAASTQSAGAVGAGEAGETVYEREVLASAGKPPGVGFQIQPYQSKLSEPIKMSKAKIEANRIARSSMEYTPVSLQMVRNRSAEWALWREASEDDPPYPDHYDPEYNSNIWRNFADKSAKSLSAKAKNKPSARVTESIAKMHPLPIPPYNRLGRYTYAKFLSEVSVIPDSRKNQGEILRHLTDLKEYRKLKLHSELRRPPIDVYGRIVPPSTMKKYNRRPTDSPEPVGLDNNPPYYIVDIREKNKMQPRGAFPVRYVFKENPLSTTR